MTHESIALLKQFQCEHTRMLEEVFAQTLSERNNVRLFFINGNRAFTDGRNIIVDPAMFGLFADENALIRTGKHLGWSPEILGSAWNALGIITRALNIHECLHILYTDFPCRCVDDPRCTTRNQQKVMAKISNIIEDAYIEAVGCSCYDNMEFYLRFMRVSQSFLSGRIETEVLSLKDLLSQGEIKVPKKKERTDADRIEEYLGNMAVFLLYPWDWKDACHPDIAEYVNRTKQFYLDGSVADSPDERYEYCQKIFDVIKDIIPDDDKELGFAELSKILIGGETHGNESGTATDAQNRGRVQKVTRRLFTDLSGKKIKDSTTKEQLAKVISGLTLNQSAARPATEDEGSAWVIPVSDTGAPATHDKIKIIENHPKINQGLRKAYKNIYSKYSTNIRSYNSKFEQLLRAHATIRENGFVFGSGISSGRLGNPHKKYWYRQQEGTSMPDLAVMLLIDGSGSMDGARIKSATESAVILHEVLKQQDITHAVVEHRAHGYEPEMEVNILVDFNGREDQKLNIMQLCAGGDNRDGLALYWAEKYIGKMIQNDYKVIIVLSDGVPAHAADNYFPPDSVKDTANAVRTIKKRGTNIIGISLDDDGEFECYGQLSEIYPNLIACNDLSRLTGQILGVIAKLLV